MFMDARTLAGGLLVVLVVATPVRAEENGFDFDHCVESRVSLEGADHYYWLSPEKGRIVLDRTCGPIDADCDHDVITVWDRRGRKIFEAAPYLDIPRMPRGPIQDATLRTPDRLVVSTAVDGAGKVFPPVLAEYDVIRGELLSIVRTGWVGCLDLAGDHDGITWCLGHDYARHRAGEDYDLVYRFDEAGVLQSSALPRSTFPAEAEPLAGTWRGNVRGGFLGEAGPLRLWLPEVGELISFDDAGGVAERLVLPTVIGQLRAHLVSATDGAIYAMLMAGDATVPEECTQRLYRLADDGSEWVPLARLDDTIPKQMALVGADEQGLMLLDRKNLGLCHLPLGDYAMGARFIHSYVLDRPFCRMAEFESLGPLPQHRSAPSIFSRFLRVACKMPSLHA